MWDLPGVTGSTWAPSYPPNVPEFKGSMENLTLQCRDLLRKLLRVVGKSLHLEDPDYLLKIHQNLEDEKMFSRSTIRCLYYPPLPENQVIPKNGIRCREVCKVCLARSDSQQNFASFKGVTRSGKSFPFCEHFFLFRSH